MDRRTSARTPVRTSARNPAVCRHSKKKYVAIGFAAGVVATTSAIGLGYFAATMKRDYDVIMKNERDRQDIINQNLVNFKKNNHRLYAENTGNIV